MWQTKILERLFAGEEYKADDPDLIKLTETAMNYRDNIKTILGFWIPDNCSPTWLLGMLVQKFGLKTASRKKGSSGSQVKYYSLAVEEFVLAQKVLEYRTEQRIKREERKRQRREENRLYQIMLETQYGITPDSISTPDQNNDFTNIEQGVDIAKSQSEGALDKIKPGMNLLKTVSKGLDLVKGLADILSYPNWMRELLIDWLKYSIKSMPT